MTKNEHKKSVRKIILIILFVIINAVVIAVTAVNEFGNSKNAAKLSEVVLNWWMLIPAALFFVVATILNVLKYVLMIKQANKEAGKKISGSEVRKLSWRVVMLGRYYDNVTPASIGGQPFQIYHMRKNSDLPSGYTTSIPFCGMVSGQIGFLVVALVCFAFGSVFKENPALLVAGWIGLLVYAFWPVMIAGTSFFPKATSKFLLFGVKVLAKIRIVKNREEALLKVEREVKEYSKSLKTILKIRGLFIKIVLLATFHNFMIMAIPYFVLKAFGGDMDFFKCLATTTAVTAAVYFVPTPGNAGAAEGTFYAVFSSLSTGYVFWAMLVWRFFTFYIYIIIGPLTYLRMHSEKKHNKIVKNHNQKPDGDKKI